MPFRGISSVRADGLTLLPRLLNICLIYNFKMLILLLRLISSTNACHFTKIGYENGTWCCGDTKQADVGDDG